MENMTAVSGRDPVECSGIFYCSRMSSLGYLMQWVRDSASHKGRMKSKDLATGHFLGQGCSGIFYETTWSQDSTVKLARKDFPGVNGDIFKREVIRLFEVSNHPNVVKTLGWTVDKRSCSLVMEYVRDDLSSFMRRKKETQKGKANQPGIGTSLAIFQLHEAMDIALQIAVGVEYLHDNGVTHGDLKPNNVLIDSGKEGRLLVKVADFGLIETKRRSTLISQRALCFRMIEWSAPELFEDYFRSQDLDYLWTESLTGLDTGASSTSNIDDCPEILITKADSYSFALTCACILGGQMWDANLGPTELRRHICCGLRPKLPSECPETLRSLISSCWDGNPQRRPTFSFIRKRLQEIIQEQSMLEVESSRLFTDQLDVKKEMIKDHIKTVEPHSQVSEGLRTIDNVTKFSENAAPRLATSIEEMKLLVSEKSEDTSESLPSYLEIDIAEVEITGSLRKPSRFSNHDPNVTDGWTLVQRARWLGCDLAIKVFKSGDTTWNKKELLKEMSPLMKHQHPQLVRLMGFAQDEEKCYILMELMDTDLRDLMNQRSPQGKRPFTRVQELDIITQIAKGMYYLHEQQYVHGELKCSNILVKQIGSYFGVKISDFRSSQKLGIWDPVLFRERSKRRRPRWTAPEVQKYGEVEPTHELLKKTDVYGFGMVCYEVVTGKIPFQDVSGDELKSRIEKGDLKQELPGELDPKLRGLIESCWERDPEKRPTFEAICHLLNHIVRSSQLAVTTKSSGKDTVQSLIRWNPKVLGQFADREEMNATRSTGSFGSIFTQINVDDGMQVDSDPGAANAVTLPEFVRIDPASLKKVRRIGEGAFAKVYEATWLGCNFAVKEFPSSSPSEVQAEVNLLVKIRHPCIVQLIGLAVHTDRQCSIVMELMGCDLRCLIGYRMRIVRIRNAEPKPVLHLHEGVKTLDSWNKTEGAVMSVHNLVQHSELRKLNMTVGSVMARYLSESRKLNKTVGSVIVSSSREALKMSKTVGSIISAQDLKLLLNSRRSTQNKVGSVASAERLRPLPFHDGPFDIHEVLHIISRITLGMLYLHSRGVAHRDLKATNVLVPDLIGCLDVKIADFGVAQLVDKKRSRLGVGTGFWMAPEVSAWKRPGIEDAPGVGFSDLKAADVYSFAMTCYEVVTGKVPMQDQVMEGGLQVVRLKVIEGLRPALPSDLDPSLRRLIEECWNADPAERPTFSTICERLQQIRLAVDGKELV